MKKNQGKVYRDKMNKLEEKLTKENREYFSDLRMYMTLASVLVDETELEFQLYQMGSDLLAAQADGGSALEFFGNQPQEMADELLRHTKKANGKQLIAMLFLVIGILWGINLLADFSSPGTVMLSWPQYVISAGLGLLGVGLLFWILKKSVYTSGVASLRSRKTQLVMTVAMVAVFLGVIAVQVVADLLFVDMGIIRVLFPFDLLFLGILGLILTLVFVKTKGKLSYPLVFFLYVLLAIGVIQRLLVAGQLPGSHWRAVQLVMLVGAAVIGLVWQWGMNRRNLDLKK